MINILICWDSGEKGIWTGRLSGDRRLDLIVKTLVEGAPGTKKGREMLVSKDRM